MGILFTRSGGHDNLQAVVDHGGVRGWGLEKVVLWRWPGAVAGLIQSANSPHTGHQQSLSVTWSLMDFPTFRDHSAIKNTGC